MIFMNFVFLHQKSINFPLCVFVCVCVCVCECVCECVSVCVCAGGRGEGSWKQDDSTLLSNCTVQSFFLGQSQTRGRDVKLKGGAGNTTGGSITVPLTSCLTGLESAV